MCFDIHSACILSVCSAMTMTRCDLTPVRLVELVRDLCEWDQHGSKQVFAVWDAREWQTRNFNSANLPLYGFYTKHLCVTYDVAKINDDYPVNIDHSVLCAELQHSLLLFRKLRTKQIDICNAIIVHFEIIENGDLMLISSTHLCDNSEIFHDNGMKIVFRTKMMWSNVYELYNIVVQSLHIDKRRQTP